MTPKRWQLNMRPRELPFRRRLARASVALIYRQSEDCGVELLFIQRARREGDPWSGDMAFPGGRMQPEDASPRAAAERETREETGVDLISHGHFQTRLSDLVTRQHSRWLPMVITPYVYEWRGPQAVSPNHEVAKIPRRQVTKLRKKTGGYAAKSQILVAKPSCQLIRPTLLRQSLGT